MSLKSFSKRTGAVATKAIVFYERKISDGNYGSVGGGLHVEFSLPPKGDPDELIDSAFDEVKQKAVDLLKASFKAVDESIEKKQTVQPDPDAPPKYPLEEPVQIPPEDPSWCPIHQCQMKQYSKEGRSWYSHKAGDSWCKGK